MNKQLFLYPFFGIFALAGLICGVVAFNSLSNRNRMENTGEKTMGTVIDLNHSENMSAPIIGFKDQNGGSRVFHSTTYTNIDPYEIGQSVSLYFDPANPTDVMLEDDGWLYWLPFLFLFTHGGLGFGGLVWLERKRRRMKWLKSYGQEIWAIFKEVKLTAQKGRYYTLICTWDDPYTNLSHTFKSESRRKDPSGFLSPGALVRVLIDPANPKRYWVDTSTFEG